MTSSIPIYNRYLWSRDRDLLTLQADTHFDKWNYKMVINWDSLKAQLDGGIFKY